MRGTLTAALVAAALAPAVARPQAVDPSGVWRTLHTEHFRVHFRPSYRAAAHAAAREAERAYDLLAAELTPPRGSVDLVLADDVDIANGFAAVFPSNRVTVLLTPPAGDPALQDYDDWLRIVIVHEVAHVFHLDRSRGVWRVLQVVFGRAPGLFPNTYQPSWVVEGVATYYESRLSSAGRVDGGFHRQLLAADAAAGATRRPWDAVLFTRWPDGLTPYAYGATFFGRVGETAGDSAVPRFVEATAGQLIPFRVGRPLRRVSAALPLEPVWRAAVRPVAAQPAPPGETIADGLVVEPVPRVSPDGRRVAYVVDDGRAARRLVVADAGTLRPQRARRVTSGVRYDWLGDTLVVAQLDFTGRWTVRSDLYDWRPDGTWARRTRVARLTAPRGGGGRLAVIALEPAGNRPFLPGVPDSGATWGDVAPSPDGRRFAAARHAAGNWSLVWWPADDPAAMETLIAGQALVTDVGWTPGGDLLFVSDRAGLPQVYRRGAGGEVAALTAEPSGARSPAALADGALLYTTLTGRGWALRRLREPLAAPAPPAAAPLPFAGARPVAARETRYAGGPSLWPRYWLPAFRDAGPAGRFVGGSTTGADAVGRHAYFVRGHVAWDPLRAGGDVRYVNQTLGDPTIDAGVTHDWSWVGSAAGTVVSAAETDASVGATFAAPRWRSAASLRVAAEWESVRFAAEPDTVVTDLCPTCIPRRFLGGAATLRLAHAVLAPFAVSRQDGAGWSLTYRRREALRSLDWSDDVRTRLDLYLRLPRAGLWAHPVLATRLAVGASSGPAATRFAVGGLSSGTLDLGFGTPLGEARTFPVRGFDAGTARGHRAATIAVELRVPVALVGRSLGHLPVGVDKVWLALFADVGDAWEPGDTFRGRLRSAGAELVGDVSVVYDRLVRVRVGGARTLAGPGALRTRFYAAVGPDF